MSPKDAKARGTDCSARETVSAAGPGPGVQRLNSGSFKHEDMNRRRGGSFARRPERRPLVADGKRQRACEARGRDPRLGRLARRIQLAAPRRSPWRPAARGLVRQRSAPAADALRRGTFGGSGKSETQKRQRSRTPRRERAGPPTRSATPEPGGVSLLPLRVALRGPRRPATRARGQRLGEAVLRGGLRRQRRRTGRLRRTRC